MDIINTAKAFKWLKIWFESSTMVLTNVTTFGVAVGATVLAVEVEGQRLPRCRVAPMRPRLTREVLLEAPVPS